ncbi:hypothetical protein TA3x_003214 [Tundrisphaera sp. TA3]|uniref:hypothetical protein n=1 Tax=Tundrisphaera sp. TA3 TaxID=3435775 RepID=UPI003EBE463F
MSGALLLTMLLAQVAEPDDRSTPQLMVTARAEARSFYVGEAFSVDVEVAGATGPIRVDPPSPAEAEIHRVEPSPTPPLEHQGSSAGRFVVIPNRAGPLVIPPFKVHSGDRAGASKPLRRTILGVPSQGRPSAFLGGVGRFEVAAKLDTPTLLVGSTTNYRLEIVGEAASGSARPPDLAGWASKIPGLRVRSFPASEFLPDPPTRTFIYQIRPTRPGRWTLPPVAVAAYDPASRRFQTRYTPGISLLVVLPDRSDPALPEVSSTSPAASPGPGDRTWVDVGGGIVLAVLMSVFLAVRLGPRMADDPRRVATRWASRLDPDRDGVTAARQVAAAFADYLRAIGHPPSAVVTPPEIDATIAEITEDPVLPGRCRRLIERCDRARFGEGEREGRELIGEAKQVFLDLARRGVRRGTVGGSRDREAR